MSAQHTPGPWTTKPSPESSYWEIALAQYSTLPADKAKTFAQGDPRGHSQSHRSRIVSAQHTPGPRITGSGFDPETGGFKHLSLDGVRIDTRLVVSAQALHTALDRIMLRAVRQQARGGDLFDFQDALRECADIARAAIAKATGAAL